MKFKIKALTVRNKATNELIFAEGIRSEMDRSDVILDEKWFTEEDLAECCDGWSKIKNDYVFDDSARYLFIYEYDLITFAIEELEIK